MKKSKKIMALAMTATMVASVGAFPASVSAEDAQVNDVVSSASQSTSVKIVDKEKYKRVSFSGVESVDAFTVQTDPSYVSTYNYHFESSDESVLTIGENGYCVPHSAGAVMVYVVDDEGTLLDYMPVSVFNEVTEVGFTKQTNLIATGQTFDFEAKVLDEYPIDSYVTYKTVPESVGRIDRQSGRFIALKGGTCYVFAQASNGVEKICQVTVAKALYKGSDYGLSVKKKKSKATLKWKAIPGATKYQVQKKTKKGKWKTVKTLKSTKYVDKKFKDTSSYRLRAKYSILGKSGTHGWSKTVKAKK